MLALSLAPASACAGDRPATPAGRPVTGDVRTVAVETLRVMLPRAADVPERVPLWRRRLTDVALTDGRLWSAYAPAGLAANDDGQLFVVDAANHELIALDSAGRVAALAGGLGQAPDELYAPGDAAPSGRQLVVADRGNARLLAYPVRHVGAPSQLALPGPPVRLASDAGTLFALTLVPRQSPRLIRIARCCAHVLADTLTLTPPVRVIPRGIAVMADGRIAILALTGELALYAADGTLTQMVHFVEPRPANHESTGSDSADGRAVTAPGGGAVPMPGPAAAAPPPGRSAVALAASRDGDRLLLSFGDVLGCFDAATGSLAELWRPPPDADGRRRAATALVAASARGTYTYQPASSTAARYAGGC
jgi:hypothetical protein